MALAASVNASPTMAHIIIHGSMCIAYGGNNVAEDSTTTTTGRDVTDAAWSNLKVQ